MNRLSLSVWKILIVARFSGMVPFKSQTTCYVIMSIIIYYLQVRWAMNITAKVLMIE